MKHSTKYINICKKTVLNQIDQSKFAVFLFGSRATGQASKYSDIDIGILGKDKFSLQSIFKIKNILDEKDMPYKIDIIDFNRVDENFKEIALRDIIIWNQPHDLKIN